MVKKRGPGRPPKKRRGRPPGSKNKTTVQGYINKRQSEIANRPMRDIGAEMGMKPFDHLTYIKDYNEPPSFHSRLEAATVRFEQAVNETIEQLKGKM